ncbi:hypothetical protein GCM10009117_00980 [Gangjinia marincola]|uniref:Uncharacterized protein n=1 Tax=Gangjinia marincola TaxID=578463 RepID=A0ABP3XS18_9FLAO
MKTKNFIFTLAAVATLSITTISFAQQQPQEKSETKTTKQLPKVEKAEIKIPTKG